MSTMRLVATTELLYAARGLRAFGDGFAVILLPAYLTEIGYDSIGIGIVAAASLLLQALLSPFQAAAVDLARFSSRNCFRTSCKPNSPSEFSSILTHEESGTSTGRSVLMGGATLFER